MPLAMVDNSMGDWELHYNSWNLIALGFGSAESSDANAGPTTPTPLERHAEWPLCDYRVAPEPANEAERVQYLRHLGIMDTPFDERYDCITQLLGKQLAVPVAILTHLDHERAFCKSFVGLPGLDARGPPRSAALCALLMMPPEPETLCSTNMEADPRFMHNPQVAGPPHVRSYIGAPLVCSNALRLGSLCIMDLMPRYFTAEDSTLVTNFSELVMREMEVQFAGEQNILEHIARPREAFAGGVVLIEREIVDAKTWRIHYASTRACELLGKAAASLVGQDFWDVVALPAAAAATEFDTCMDSLADFAFNASTLLEDGRKARLSCKARVATAPLNDMATIIAPVDLLSEDTLLNRLYFVTLYNADANRAVKGPEGQLRRTLSVLLEQLVPSEPMDSLLGASGTVFVSHGANGYVIEFASEVASRILGIPSSSLLGFPILRVLGEPGDAALDGSSVLERLKGTCDFTFEAITRTRGVSGSRVHVTAEYCADSLPRRRINTLDAVWETDSSKSSNIAAPDGDCAMAQDPTHDYVWCLRVAFLGAFDAAPSAAGQPIRRASIERRKLGPSSRSSFDSGTLPEPVLPSYMRLGRNVARHLHGVVTHTISDGLGPSNRGLVHVLRVHGGKQAGAMERRRLCERICEISMHAENRSVLAGAVLRSAHSSFSMGGRPSVTILKELDSPCIGSLRCCVHGNWYKEKRGPDELVRGAVAINFTRVLTTLVVLASALSKIHAAGTTHGEVTDSTVLMLASQDARSVVRPIFFCSGLEKELCTNLEDVLSVRDDYIIFFAPERYEGLFKQPLAPPTAAADVWGLGVLALLMASFSLPLLELGASDVLELAKTGRLCTTVFGPSAARAPSEFVALAERCMNPDPQLRPSASTVQQEAQSMLEAIA